MTPEQFDEWCAFAILEGWGTDWQQTGTIAAMVHNVNCTKEKDLKTPSYFIPPPIADEPPKREPVGGRQAARLARLRYGGA